MVKEGSEHSKKYFVHWKFQNTSCGPIISGIEEENKKKETPPKLGFLGRKHKKKCIKSKD